MLERIPGGITAPAGFRAAGVACGIKSSGLDLALLTSTPPARAAGIFTTNLAVAAPVTVTREHLRRSDGTTAAVVVNSGCANACTGVRGLTDARDMALTTADLVGCPVEQVLVSSTGVIGAYLDRDKLRQGIRLAAETLGPEGHAAAAEAIMTTDPWPKDAAVRAAAPSGRFHVGGMAKGAGMIEPNMATMLAFLTTDAAVEPPLLRRALREAAETTFNAITVDGEPSTNDMVLALANGASGTAIDDASYPAFVEALHAVCHELARAVVKGGEGATKLVAVSVTGAESAAEAKRAARAIANSPLVKTAVHGGDPTGAASSRWRAGPASGSTPPARAWPSAESSSSATSRSSPTANRRRPSTCGQRRWRSPSISAPAARGPPPSGPATSAPSTSTSTPTTGPDGAGYGTREGGRPHRTTRTTAPDNADRGT